MSGMFGRVKGKEKLRPRRQEGKNEEEQEGVEEVKGRCGGQGQAWKAKNEEEKEEEK